MSTITNQAQRLDILQINGNAHVFTLQILNTTDGNFINVSVNPLNMILKDARANDVGTPTVVLINNEKASFDIKAIVPAGYSGTLKYAIEYTDAGNGDTLQLLKGNIDCVDSVHMPANTADYVTDGSDITVNAAIGTTNNIVLTITNGLTGPQGPQGIQGTPGIVNANDIIAILGYTPYDEANPAGYITGLNWADIGGTITDGMYIATYVNNAIGQVLSSYATQQWVQQQGYITGTPWTGMGYITGTAVASAYVPYTGATGNVNLGANSLFAANLGVGVSSGLTATLQARGSSNISGIAFKVQNSSPSDLFVVQNNGSIGLPVNCKLYFGTADNPSYAYMKGVGSIIVIPGANNSAVLRTESGILGNYLNDGDIINNFITASHNTTDAKQVSIVGVTNTFAPNVGSAISNALIIKSTIGQYGSANGISRGLFVNPTLTSAYDYRAIEAITGNNAAHTLLRLNNGTQDVLLVKGDNKIGLFNATPVAQATGGAATASASFTAAEQLMLQKVYDAVRGIGILS